MSCKSLEAADIAFGIVIGVGIGLVGFSAIAANMVRKLDAATRQQCATADWPAHQANAHIKWCNNNGYQTPTLHASGLDTGH